MPNLPLNEDTLVRMLREAETPPPRTDLLEVLQAKSRRRPRPWVWALPVTAATMITLALIPVLSLPPSISLAQVASAFDARTQYTIVNTRLMNKGERASNGPRTEADICGGKAAGTACLTKRSASSIFVGSRSSWRSMSLNPQWSKSFEWIGSFGQV
jgi:hypothetical protein